MSEEETIKYRDAFPKDYDLPTYFTSKHAISMTLRDYFAAKAMQSLITASVTEPGCVGSTDNISECAYQFADAMLKAREV